MSAVKQAVGVHAILGTPADPIATFGREASKVIIQTVKRLPATQRKTAIKAWLDGLDPTLAKEAETRAVKFQGQGIDATRALQQGLQIALANSMVHALVDHGKGDSTRLQCLGCSCSPIGVDGLWDTITSAASSVKSAVGTAYNTVKDGVEKVGELACQAVNNPSASTVASVAGGAASTYFGGNPTTGAQAGRTGVSVGQKICGWAGQGPAPASPGLAFDITGATVRGIGAQQTFTQVRPPAPPPAKLPVVPIAAGAGILALLAFL